MLYFLQNPLITSLNTLCSDLHKVLKEVTQKKKEKERST